MAAAPLQPQASAVESFLPPRSGSVTLWSAPIWPGSIPTQLTGLPSRHAAAGFRCPDFLWLCCCSAVGDADADAAFPRSIAACAFPPQPPGNLRHDCWPRLVTALRRRPGRGCDDAVCSAPAKRRRQPTNGSIAHFVRAHRSEARRPHCSMRSYRRHTPQRDRQSTPRAGEGLPAGAARLGRAALQNHLFELQDAVVDVEGVCHDAHQGSLVTRFSRPLATLRTFPWSFLAASRRLRVVRREPARSHTRPACARLVYYCHL